MKRYSFSDFVEKINHHLSLINFERTKYHIEVNDQNTSLVVLYDNTKYIQFRYYISNIINSNGSRTVKGAFTITMHNDSRWYAEWNTKWNLETVHIDEFLTCNYNDKQHVNFDKMISELFPISSYEEEEKIKKNLLENNLENFEIKFDTHSNRYVIVGDIARVIGISLNEENEKGDLFLYKYMSMQTYYSMLVNRSFRMNSIISMNDLSESLFLGETICKAYSNGNKTDVYKNIIKNRNALISSFTDKYDDPLMWLLYGDKGKGVCLNCSIPKDKIQKIRYITGKEEGYSKLKSIADKLEKDGIRIYFKDIDIYKFYIKSRGFEHEKEYRLQITTDSSNLQTALYDNLLSPYQDFKYINRKFEKIEVEPRSLIIGNNLSNFDTNYPLLVDLSKKVFDIDIVNISQFKEYRI